MVDQKKFYISFLTKLLGSLLVVWFILPEFLEWLTVLAVPKAAQHAFLRTVNEQVWELRENHFNS